MGVVEISLSRLRAHPHNSNVMGRDALAKLTRQLGRTGRYPPVIVRPLTRTGEVAGSHGNPATPQRETSDYQILDGHHRVAALRRLGLDAARCVVWDGVDDEEALLLLATLNRLEGQDDPGKRAALLAELGARRGLEELARALPESRERLTRLVALNRPAPPPRAARAADEMPQAVHFFLLPKQRRALEAALRRLGGGREAALMRMVEQQG